MMDDREERQEKRQRVPVGGVATNLQLSEYDLQAMRELGKVPHWFNDANGRVERAVAGGYEFVPPENAGSVGGDIVNQGRQRRVSKISSRSGPPVRAFLMWIDKEFYDEDQRSKEQRNISVEQAMRPVGQGGQSIEGGYTPT